MFVDKDSIIIDNVNFGNYITEAKYGYNKIWGNDTGRNLAGTMSGTLIGIFPKITLQFRKLTKSELEIVIPILDKAQQSFTYYDPFKKKKVTMNTYTGDYEIVNRNIVDAIRRNEGFSCSFISKGKRK